MTVAAAIDRVAHFNSDDLEQGTDDKGLSGGVGAGEGDWRLELTSDLDVEVLSYIRAAGGLLTRSMTWSPARGRGTVSRRSTRGATGARRACCGSSLRGRWRPR